MTSLAFILGVLPLALSKRRGGRGAERDRHRGDRRRGRGHGARRPLVPAFYVVMARKRMKHPEQAGGETAPHGHMRTLLE
jgi:hypothetical protein